MPYGAFETCGTVFELKRSGHTWTEVVVHSFNGADGAGPGGLTFDGAGNLYGTAGGGAYGAGTVFELTPNPDGTWTEATLHNFNPAAGDGAEPDYGLTFDHAGNLYGATLVGGKTYKACTQGCGTVFQLSPNRDGTWSESVIFQFGPNQPFPNTALVFDEAGDIYGTTAGTGSDNVFGTAFRLVPEGGNWKESSYAFNGFDGFNPTATLLLHGNAAYGTNSQTLGINCQISCGNIFKIQGGRETVLYTFCLQGDFCPDGDQPAAGGPLLSGNGNLYGAAGVGGAYGDGVIFQLTP